MIARIVSLKHRGSPAMKIKAQNQIDQAVSQSIHRCYGITPTKKDPRSGQKISFLSALMGLPTLTSNFSMIAGAVVGGIPNPILISSCHISQKAWRVSRDSAQSPTWSVEATERLQLI
jgi:hypothetical protein